MWGIYYSEPWEIVFDIFIVVMILRGNLQFWMQHHYYKYIFNIFFTYLKNYGK